MSILPRVKGGFVCIPWWEVPLIWSWRTLTWALMIFGALDIAVISMYGLASLSIETLLAVIAVSIMVSTCYYVFVYLDRYNRQVKQAEEIMLTAAQEKRELTALEKIECDKVQNFDKVFLVTILTGIIISVVIATLADLAIGGHYLVPSDEIVLYGVGAIVASASASFFIDNFVVGAVCSGTWRDKVSKLYADATKSLQKSADSGSKDASKEQISAILEALAAQFKN